MLFLRLAFAVLFLCRVTPAWGMIGDTDGTFGVDGSARMLLLGARGMPNAGQGAHDALTQGNFRFLLGGKPTDWFDFEINAVMSTTVATAGLSRSMRTRGGWIRNRTVDTRWEWIDEELSESDIYSMGFLDRANFKIKHELLDITIGRQAISLGTGFFWNPLDVFRPFGATQFDRDYKGGVDALRVDIPVGDFSGLTLVGVAGRDVKEASWLRSSVLLRGYTTFHGWDLTAQGGKIFGGYQLGGAIAGDVHGVSVLSELSWYQPDSQDISPAYGMGVVGVGYRFLSGLYLGMEYLYNGLVMTRELEGFRENSSHQLFEALNQSGRLMHISGNLLGSLAQYEFIPILSGSFVVLYSLSDKSLLVQPGLSLSISDESDLVVGGMIPYGNSEEITEFGSLPPMVYMQMKAYF